MAGVSFVLQVQNKDLINSKVISKESKPTLIQKLMVVINCKTKLGDSDRIKNFP